MQANTEALRTPSTACQWRSGSEPLSRSQLTHPLPGGCCRNPNYGFLFSVPRGGWRASPGGSILAAKVAHFLAAIDTLRL
jgi:hypothetical protein